MSSELVPRKIDKTQIKPTFPKSHARVEKSLDGLLAAVERNSKIIQQIQHDVAKITGKTIPDKKNELPNKQEPLDTEIPDRQVAPSMDTFLRKLEAGIQAPPKTRLEQLKRSFLQPGVKVVEKTTEDGVNYVTLNRIARKGSRGYDLTRATVLWGEISSGTKQSETQGEITITADNSGKKKRIKEVALFAHDPVAYPELRERYSTNGTPPVEVTFNLGEQIIKTYYPKESTEDTSNGSDIWVYVPKTDAFHALTYNPETAEYQIKNDVPPVPSGVAIDDVQELLFPFPNEPLT